MRLLKILIPAAIAAGLLLLYFQRPPDPVGLPLAAANIAPDRPIAPAVAVDRSQPVRVRDISAGIRKQFEESSNYAAFIHGSMQRPEEGGRFYALIAFNRCAEISTINAARPEAKPSAEQAKAAGIIDALKAKCSGVKDYFPDELGFLRVLKSANSKGVPDALLVERGVFAPPSRELAAHDVRRAIESGDPYLIAATLDLNIDFLAEKLIPEFANGNERLVLYLASAAAACEIVGNCNNHYRAIAACLEGAACTQSDYRDYLRELAPARSRELFDKTRAALVSLAGQRALN